MPELGASCRGFEAAFCCAALVLPDDTWADAATVPASKTVVTRADIRPVFMVIPVLSVRLNRNNVRRAAVVPCENRRPE